MARPKEILYAVGVGALLFAFGIRRRGRRYRFVDNSAKSTDEVRSYPGYQIINCERINIISENASYKYAFSSGKLSKQDIGLFNSLFGGENCFNSLISFINDAESFKFVYSLIIAFLAGKTFVKTITIEIAIVTANTIKEKFKYFDSNWPDIKPYILEMVDRYK